MIAEAALCLALNVYHEARGEPRQGQLAVALATRNRAVEEGNGVCWVVFRYAQFSWTMDARKLRRLPNGPQWEASQRVAEQVLYGAYDFTKGATHYHAVKVQPRWAGTLERAGQWGDHVFYRPRPGLRYTVGSSTSKSSPGSPGPRNAGRLF